MKNHVLIFLLLFLTLPLLAQQQRNSLIFSEVYLNVNYPTQSWIEVYNPTTQALVLKNFRFSRILTDNIFPTEIQDKGGMLVNPGKCIVLCAKLIDFSFKTNKEISVIEVPEMAHFNKGGFFSLQTENYEDGGDLFRYGEPGKSLKVLSETGDYVVPFSSDNKSFHRIKSDESNIIINSYFYSANPTPGQYN